MLLDEGLGLSTGQPQTLGTEFDLDDLIRMDTPTRVKAAQDSIGSGGMSPNEARKKYFGLGPVPGGDSCYMQQQQFSLEALSKRDENIGILPPTQVFSPADNVGTNLQQEQQQPAEDAQAAKYLEMDSLSIGRECLLEFRKVA